MGWCILAMWSRFARTRVRWRDKETVVGARVTARARLLRASIENAFILLLAGLLACASVPSAAASGARRARAVAAYERAVNLRTALESKPEKERQEADYQQVISLFQSV
jgi:hypothetical protein